MMSNWMWMKRPVGFTQLAGGPDVVISHGSSFFFPPSTRMPATPTPGEFFPRLDWTATKQPTKMKKLVFIAQVLTDSEPPLGPGHSGMSFPTMTHFRYFSRHLYDQ